MKSGDRILVTGATGYVGGRLINHLVKAGYQVRALVRDTSRVQGRTWHDQVEVVQADALLIDTLHPALEGVTSAYYLIHSMMAGTDFYQRDLLAAHNFGRAAKDAGIERIIYLGGLGEPESDLSNHLHSRHLIGDKLGKSGVPVTEFRAAVIVGSGSASFDMIRYLVERLPVLLCPKYAGTRIQPIGIGNLLDYLVAALEVPDSAGRTIEIGGADVLTYHQMLDIYAQVRGLSRFTRQVSWLPTQYAKFCIHYVTPIPPEIARPLIEGLRNDVVVRDRSASELFPDIRLEDYRTTVSQALSRLEASQVESRWADALASRPIYAPTVTFEDQHGMIVERRQLRLKDPPESIFLSITAIGGEHGWPFMNWAWVLRGRLDRLVGGVGFRRGRRHPTKLRVGDALDFWRVEAVETNHLLRLRSEMRMPGPAWLEFTITPDSENHSLHQNAYFAPKGFWGFAYWYLLYPIHSVIFSGMIQSLARKAENITKMNNRVKQSAMDSALDFSSSRAGDVSALWSIPTGFTCFACPVVPLSGAFCLPRSSLELLKVLIPFDVRPFAL